METSSAPSISARCWFRRLRWFGFPVEEILEEGSPVAQLGRDGSLRVFFGPGRRIRLADGTEWRIKAVASGRHIVPIVTSVRGPVAISGPLHARRSYGINGKGYGLTLIPLGRVGIRRPSQWAMQHHETDVAIIEDPGPIIHPAEPIPLAAALLACTLITHGIPGEADLMPTRD